MGKINVYCQGTCSVAPDSPGVTDFVCRHVTLFVLFFVCLFVCLFVFFNSILLQSCQVRRFTSIIINLEPSSSVRTWSRLLSHMQEQCVNLLKSFLIENLARSQAKTSNEVGKKI